MTTLKKSIIIAASVLVLAAVSTVSVFAIKGSGKTVSAQVPEDFEAEPLSVVFVSPTGLIENHIRYPEIQIQFSDPVVPLAQLGAQSDKCDYAQITPALSGYWKWTGTSTLSFVSRDAIIPQKQYTVKISPSVKSIYGKALTGESEFEFHTEELRILQILPGYEHVQKGEYVNNSSVPLEQCKDIGLVFNTAVTIDTLKDFITVKAGTSGNKTFTIKQPNETTLQLSVKENFVEDEKVTVALKKGARAASDTIPTTSKKELSFDTLEAFSITDVYLNQWGSSEFSNPIYFYFSAQLKNGTEEEVAKLLSCSIPNYTITKDNLNISGSRLILHNLPVKFDEDLEVTLKAGIKDIYGRTFTQDVSKTIHIPPARGYAYFKNSGFKILEAQFLPKIAFEFQNIKGGRHELTKITDAGGNPVPESPQEVLYDEDSFPKDTRIIHAIDLTPALTKVQNQYHGALFFKAKMDYSYYYQDWYSSAYKKQDASEENTQALQVTDLGLTVRYGFNKAAVLVSSLSTGKPVANAKVSAYSFKWNTSSIDILKRKNSVISSAVSDKNGLAVIDLNGTSGQELDNLFIEAVTSDKTDSVIFRANQTSMWRYGVNTDDPSSALKQKDVVFIFTDRGLYKPGETVTYRIIDRKLEKGRYSVPSKKSFTVEIADRTYNYDKKIFYTDTGTLDASGCTWGSFTLPEDFTPGTYYIVYNDDSDSYYSNNSTSFDVQFFERLRYEVKTSVPDIDFYRGDTVSVELSANYLGGGSMGGSSYESSWTQEPCGFYLNDPRYSNMSFGPLQDYDGRTSLGYNEGELDQNGKASLTQKTGGERIDGMAYNYRVNAQVIDSGNQAISSSKTIRVHPAKYYIGLESLLKGGYPKKGTTLNFNYVCVDPHGDAPAAGHLPANRKNALTVELLREDYKLVQQVSWDGQINTRYVQELTSESKEELTLSGKNTPEKFSVTPKKGGRYLLRVSSTDADGNAVISEKYFYVTGGDWYWYSRENSNEISLTPDKSEYEIGETAQLLMQSPIEKGTYMITVEREGIWSEKVIQIDEPTTVIEIPVEEKFLPVAYVTLSSYTVRKGAPTHDFNSVDLDKPKGCFGVTEIYVSTKSRSFDIAIKPDKSSYRPGEKASVKIIATKNGKPLSNADITLMGVDRGVIDLINYHVPNPVEFFYQPYRFPLRVQGGDSRSLLIDPVTYEIKNLVGGDSEDDEKLQERKNFDPTAVFVPCVTTDSNGEAVCTFTWPDTLTAYRLTAVGVLENSFAITEDEVSVANPVSVRQVLPRKLRLNDTCDLGMVISNIADKDYKVNVEFSVRDGVEGTPAEKDSLGILRSAGSASIEGSSKKDITVSGNTTKPLMFTLKAKNPGWITLQFIVRSDVVNEKIILPLEIEKPYIYETVTSIGTVSKEDAKEMIEVPVADDGYGSFYIQLDPTRLGTLHESVSYVFEYPYGCMEQRSAKVLPLIAFGDYLDVFDLNHKVTDAIEVAKKEIQSWESIQKRDGGFPYWPGGSYSSLYVSARIAEILGLAEIKGIDLDTSINKRRLADYIVDEASRFDYSNPAYYYYAASLLGRAISDDKLNSAEADENISIMSLAYLALIHLHENHKIPVSRIMKKIRSRITLTPQGADIQDKYESYWWSDGDIEKFAASLMFFSELDAADEINDHLIFELLKLQGNKGYWHSTSTTARALIAVDSYIRARNLTSLDFEATAFLNNKEIAQGTFKGVASKPVKRTLDFSDIRSMIGKTVPLTFKKSGTGDLYYTMSLKYALLPQKQTPRDEGICLYTEIYDSKTGELVTGNALEEGKVYREKVYVSSTKNLEYVALRAPVPAGCEILNAAFVTTDASARDNYSRDDDDDYYYRWWKWSVSHQDIYDCEVQYFWDSFDRGNTSVEFMFRATRPGTYETPCVTAECMYEEEIFGRTAGKVWTIK